MIDFTSFVVKLLSKQLLDTVGLVLEPLVFADDILKQS